MNINQLMQKQQKLLQKSIMYYNQGNKDRAKFFMRLAQAELQKLENQI